MAPFTKTILVNRATRWLSGLAAAGQVAVLRWPDLLSAARADGLPEFYLATAANWAVNLCDSGLAGQVVMGLGGVVVSYDGRSVVVAVVVQ